VRGGEVRNEVLTDRTHQRTPHTTRTTQIHTYTHSQHTTHHASRSYVESLVAAEAAEGIPTDRVVVAGFSQGGAVAMTMLRSESKLAGVVGEI
jgi:predicted esterase